MTPKPRFVIFAHNGTYDKLHQVATLGLTAAAMGKEVTVVLMFWTIKKLAEGRIDEMDFPSDHVGSGDEIRALLRAKQVPSISEMFKDSKLVGDFQLVACSAGLEYMGVNGDTVTRLVDSVMGLPAILTVTAGAETTLFI
ncbi:peroxiredoxin [Nitrospira sp. KM1]|uniref:hypothetical protein n=1 Tax=Nitrospira sp. KM1 TaxID=1936990 RepID=UPI0013A7746F|nr:hypothetical protein [Nitrospira sp. KM1]BCA53004.1 peroxiredoxin [Nitrospira sp. KM1]